MSFEDKQQQIKNLFSRAEQGVKDVFESERYKQYLLTMAKFHNYSYRNIMLILMQRPDASHVAGYATWKDKFNRQVQKGEKGIPIVGYNTKKIVTKQPKIDSKTGDIICHTDGKPVMETVTKQVPVFFPVYVYDISQTAGEPLPKLAHELMGGVDGYEILMEALHNVSPFPIEFEAIRGDTKGYSDPVAKRIAIKSGMSETQTIKTAVHEITHADLHAPEIDLSLKEHTDRRTKEVQAESVAFIVCAHYGIDTSDYSFPYLAGWSSDKELKELQSSLDTIQKQSAELINRIDSQLAELQIARESVRELVGAEQDPATIIAEMEEKIEDYDFQNNVDMGIQQQDLTAYLNKLEMPDPTINIAEMEAYGFRNDTDMGIVMLPLREDKALECFEKRLPVYVLSMHGVATITHNMDELIEHLGNGGLAGIRKEDWTSYTWTNSEPVVYINFTESDSLRIGQTMSLHEANAKFSELDKMHFSEPGYYKTEFTMIYKMDGEVHTYDGRQDLGDGSGGIIDHIKAQQEYVLSPEFSAMAISEGHGEWIDGAKNALSQFVPYLQAHDALGKMNAMVHKLITDKLSNKVYKYDDIAYYDTLIRHVEDAKYALNVYKEGAEDNNHIFAAVSVDAKALGMSMQQYIYAGCEAPAERTVAIYQLKPGEENRCRRFVDTSTLNQMGETPDIKNYEKVYDGTLPKSATLDSIFSQFNINTPADYHGRSLSTRDIIVIEYKGQFTANYVDNIGYTTYPDFARQHEKALSQENREQKTELALANTAKMSMQERFTAAKAEAEQRNSISLHTAQQQQKESEEKAV